MKILKHVPSADIKNEWSHVRESLQKLLDKTNDSWLPEDVYCDIIAQNSWLYVGEDEQGDLLGFVVLSPLKQHNDLLLHIWVSVNYSDPETVFFALDDVKEIAQNIGAKKITFSTVRKGLGKLTERAGFLPGQQWFYYEV